MRKILIITILTSISYCVFAQRISSPTNTEGQTELREQMVLLSAVGELTIGNMRTAYDMLAKIVEKNPQNPVALYYMAKSMATMGQIDEALSMAGNALRTDTLNSDFLQLTGQLLIEKKEYQKAQRVFEKLLENEPNNPQNHIMTGALALETDNSKRALLIANRYEERFGFDEQMIEIKRGALIREKLYYDALGYMQRVVDAMPEVPTYLTMLGDMNAGLGLDKMAVEYYERGISLDSLQGDGYMALARFYDEKNNMIGYIDVLTRMFALQSVPVETKTNLFESSFFTPTPYRDHMMAIRKLAQVMLMAHTTDLSVRLLYGRHLTYIGQIEAAEEHYANMLEAGFKDKELYNRMIDIYFYKKENIKALQTATEATQEYPNDTDMNYRLIVAQWQADGGKVALKSIKQAFNEFKTDSLQCALYALRGDIYHEMGKDKKAFKDYDQALLINKDNALVLNNYAYFLALRKERLDDALEMANRACEIEKNFATYLDTKAWVLFTMGELDAAAAVQQRALALDRTESSELMLHYGDILYALCDDFMARKYWQKAMDAGAEKEIIDERLSRPKAIKQE